MDPPKLLESANERREDRDKNAKICMFGADGDWRGTSRRFLHKGVFENLVPRFFLPPYDRVLTHRACIHPISEIFGEALAAERTASM